MLTESSLKNLKAFLFVVVYYLTDNYGLPLLTQPRRYGAKIRTEMGGKPCQLKNGECLRI
ncbi:hypothetical protein ASE66_22615 [Bosea sp. Root483D1]|nr:hypothetical protein ASE66_22615 [Bosea sp. Root483D1]